MSSEKKQATPPDWNALAKEAMDLWQDHLSSYANDPKAKDELVKLVAPMNRMFADWTTMMQHGAEAAAEALRKQQQQPTSGADPSHESPAEPEQDIRKAGDAEAAGAASADGDDNMAQLGDRVADLERQLAELEARLAAASGDVSGKA